MHCPACQRALCAIDLLVPVARAAAAAAALAGLLAAAGLLAGGCMAAGGAAGVAGAGLPAMAVVCGLLAAVCALVAGLLSRWRPFFVYTDYIHAFKE